MSWYLQLNSMNCPYKWTEQSTASRGPLCTFPETYKKCNKENCPIKLKETKDKK